MNFHKFFLCNQTDLYISLIARGSNPGGFTTPTRTYVGHNVGKTVPRLATIGASRIIGALIALLLLLLLVPPIHAQLALLIGTKSINLAFLSEDHRVIAAGRHLGRNTGDFDLHGAGVDHYVAGSQLAVNVAAKGVNFPVLQQDYRMMQAARHLNNRALAWQIDAGGRDAGDACRIATLDITTVAAVATRSFPGYDV